MTMNRVLTFGVFDYFHLGHLRLFKQCKQHGDYLIVAVQDGEYIKKYKPDATVLYSTDQRVEMIEALRIVTEKVAKLYYIFIGNAPLYIGTRKSIIVDRVVIYQTVGVGALEKIDFDVLALGEDHRGGRFDEIEKWCDKHGKKVVRLKRTPGIASSEIKTALSLTGK